MAKNFLLFLLAISSTAQACPLGMQKIYLDFGVEGCQDSSGIRWIKGSLEQCPNGFVLQTGPHNYKICSDGRIKAYDFSHGCGAYFYPSSDSQGRHFCADLNGNPVTELRQNLN